MLQSSDLSLASLNLYMVAGNDRYGEAEYDLYVNGSPGLLLFYCPCQVY